MQLSLKLIEQLCVSLRSDPISSREQRAYPRVGVRFRQRIQPWTATDFGSHSVDAWIRDLSVYGLGLTLNRALAKDTLFVVNLATSSGSQVRIRYRVTHCQMPSEGVHTVGAQIDRMLCEPDDVPSAVLEKLSLPAAAPVPRRR